MSTTIRTGRRSLFAATAHAVETIELLVTRLPNAPPHLRTSTSTLKRIYEKNIGKYLICLCHTATLERVSLICGICSADRRHVGQRRLKWPREGSIVQKQTMASKNPIIEENPVLGAYLLIEIPRARAIAAWVCRAHWVEENTWKLLPSSLGTTKALWSSIV